MVEGEVANPGHGRRPGPALIALLLVFVLFLVMANAVGPSAPVTRAPSDAGVFTAGREFVTLRDGTVMVRIGGSLRPATFSEREMLGAHLKRLREERPIRFRD